MNDEVPQEVINREETRAERRLKKEKNFLRELIEFVAIAVFIVVPFRYFIAQPFVVNGASMDPTFHDGQYLIVDQISYRFEEPKRGSVAILKYPKDPSKFFIKRIIGLPGETISISSGTITIINEENPHGFTIEEDYVKYEKNDSESRQLGNGEYFVMGDNRFGSSDSRAWGPVPRENIIGRPIVRLLPFSSISFFPGDYSDSLSEDKQK
jgi:signal peptidase I